MAENSVKRVQVPLPELGLIAATRGMLGAGIAFLLSEKIPVERRKPVGLALLLVGAISTIPLARDVIRRMQQTAV